MDELLAIVGTSWRPLLVFPGLLTALLLTIVTSYIWQFPHAPHTTQDQHDFSASSDRGHHVIAAGGGLWSVVSGPSPTTAHLACMVLMLAFLPVPGSNWRYGIDLLVALALVEVPHWFILRRRLGSGDGSVRAGAAAETGALLNAYVLLGLAVAAVAQAASSLVLSEMRGEYSPLRWAGILVWALALPPLLAFGPWNVVGGNHVAAMVRRVAHIGLLVTLALPVEAGYPGLAIAGVVGFGSLATLDRFWHGPPERWERLQPVIAFVLLAMLLYTGASAWYARAH